jgi:hypothetical protein
MSDNTVLNAGAGGDTIATDDIGGVKHQRVKIQHGADGSAVDVSAANPLPVELGLSSPQRSYATAVAVAAGGSSDLDSDQISSGLTGKLVALILGASVAVKWELKTVSNGVPSSTLAVFFTLPGDDGVKVMPDKGFFTVAEDAGAGFDGFRVTGTNLDTSQAADIYGSFLYDEE